MTRREKACKNITQILDFRGIESSYSYLRAAGNKYIWGLFEIERAYTVFGQEDRILLTYEEKDKQSPAFGKQFCDELLVVDVRDSYNNGMLSVRGLLMKSEEVVRRAQ